MPTGFDFQPRTRVIFGTGAINRIGEVASALGTHAFLVTDPGIVAVGHLDRARRALNASSVNVTIFDAVKENPTTREVDQCVEAARAVRPQLIIGLGGGSSMDTAKGCNFLLTNGGRMQDYWGVGKANKPMLPLIAVPTTAGTGSECQSFALIADEKTHQKMACGDPKAAPSVAILDPLLTLTQPRSVAACTGIDAIAHAVETAVTKRRNELSWLYSREAFRLTISNLEHVLQRPDNLESRAAMQLGAAYAGTAIENSMLGAVHSAANPLTAHFGIVHGQAVGMMLPHVVRFNAQQPESAAIYAQLARSADLAAGSARAEQAVEALIAEIHSLLRVAQMPPSLSALNITRVELAKLAEEATGQWTARFNPRSITASDFETIYAAAL
ncbi:MAG TPA: iron-containing alcohol dehydrogenase [Terrimicrobiaceae bacterium]|nr:iron-containing alcohol dehydrogenase [Terrimicrobiaceae bacterium]